MEVYLKKDISNIIFEGQTKVIKKDFTTCQSTTARGKMENWNSCLNVKKHSL